MRIEAMVPVKVTVEFDDTDPMRCSTACPYFGSKCRLYKAVITDKLRRPGCVKDILLPRPVDDAGVKDSHWHLYKNHGLTDAQLADVIAQGDRTCDPDVRLALAESWKAAGARPKQSLGRGDNWYYGFGHSKYDGGGYAYSVSAP